MKPTIVKLTGSEKFTRLLAGIPVTSGMKSGYVTLQPGAAVGEHKTESREEAIIVLEGTASVYCEKKLLATVEAESLVYIPPEINHDIKNEGEEKLRYVYVVTPVPAVNSC
jgi:quercetin dioxygenase-like cupin family protein